MIFVTGATGFIGENLVQKLKKSGYKVKCLIRKKSKKQNQSKLGVDFVYGDIRDKDSILSAIDGCESVIHLAAITSETSSDYKISKITNVLGTQNLIEACKEKGVKRIISISSESTKRKNKGAYAQTKYEADKVVKNSGLEYTILRPSLIYGGGSRGLFIKTVQLIKKLPVIPIVGDGKQKITPIHVDDVTDAIIACVASPKTIKKEYDLIGPDKISFNQFIDLVMESIGINKKKVHIPFSLVWIGVKLVSQFIKNPPVTKDNLLGLKQEVEMSNKLAERDFGFKPMSFKEGLKKSFYYLEEATGKKRIAVIGMGKMGILHASLINKIQNAHLVAVCDQNIKLKNQLESMGIKAPFFTSMDTLLDTMPLEGVFICTPPSANQALSKKAIDKGISVFVEKPLANTIQNAEAMAQYAISKNITTSCGYMYAYHPVFQELKRILDSKRYGKIISFESSCYLSQVLTKKKRTTWQFDPSKTGGGVLITVASHLLFLIDAYFGKCAAVQGHQRKINSNMDDEVTAVLKFKEGFSGKLSAKWSVKGYDELTLGLKITTKEAIIEANNKMITINSKGKIIKKHISEINDDAEYELGGKGYYEQDKEFINCISSNKKPRTCWENALKTQKVIHSIYKSSLTKKEEQVL